MRRVLAIGLIALLGALAAGCGGGDGGGGDGAVEITFWHGQTDETKKRLEELIADFNRTHPKIHVSRDAGGVQADSMLTKVTAGLASGSYPDVAAIFGSDLASIARSPKVLDLTAAVEQPGWNWDDFFAAERAAVTVEGKIRGVPALADVLAVIYNRELFRKAGVAPPDGSWNWDQFRATAKRVTNASDGVFGTAWPGVNGEDAVWRLWPLVWQSGGEILTRDGKGIGFGGAPGLRALTTIRDLAVSDKSMYVDPEPSSARTEQLFQNRKLAMWVAGPWALVEVKQAKIGYGVARLPAYAGAHTSIAGPDNWVGFDNGAARKAATIEFLKWLLAPKQDLRFAKETGRLPLRQSVSKLPAYRRYAKAWPGIPTFVEALADARTRPMLRTYPRLSDVVGEAIISVLIGKASPEDALKAIEEQSGAALSGA